MPDRSNVFHHGANPRSSEKAKFAKSKPSRLVQAEWPYYAYGVGKIFDHRNGPGQDQVQLVQQKRRGLEVESELSRASDGL